MRASLAVPALLLLAGRPSGYVFAIPAARRSSYGVPTRTTEQLATSGTGAGGAGNWTSGWPERRRVPGPVPNPTEPWWLNDAPLQVRGAEGHRERQIETDRESRTFPHS